MMISFDDLSPFMSQHNPLIYPLCAFHQSMGRVFNPLPTVGRTKEIVDRIKMCAIAPFQYLYLILQAGFGLLMEPAYYRRHLCVKRTKLFIDLLPKT